MSLAGLKVVTGKEMAEIEKRAYADGQKEEKFLLAAGRKVGIAVSDFTSTQTTITLLCGKGNNAGDAYVAGLFLIEKGFSVRSLQLFDFDDCSELCKKYGTLFLQAGGLVQFISTAGDIIFEKNTVLVDGLLGTGFRKELTGLLLETVQKANESKLPIVAVDIPSGLNADTGEVKTSAIKATQTVFLGLPKYGFFVRDGFNHVGLLRYGFFGLHEKYTSMAHAKAYLVDESHLQEALPKVERTRHKYQAGYVIGIGGSKGMGGALKLSGSAVLRTGAGIVRLFYPNEAAREMENAPLELIREEWDEKKWEEAQKKAKAVFLGPGLGRTEESKALLDAVLHHLLKPCVIDADALYYFSEHLNAIPKNSVLTPHLQEMRRLIPDVSHTIEIFHEKVQDFVNKHEVFIVLKGAPTWIFSPNSVPLVSYRGDPGMATAGTGDVLTGVIAALLAQGCDPLTSATLGVYIHGIAGEKAACKKTSYGVIASDILELIPDSMKQIVEGLQSYEI